MANRKATTTEQVQRLIAFCSKRYNLAVVQAMNPHNDRPLTARLRALKWYKWMNDYTKLQYWVAQ